MCSASSDVDDAIKIFGGTLIVGNHDSITLFGIHPQNDLKNYSRKVTDLLLKETAELDMTIADVLSELEHFELIRPGQFYFDACYNPSKTAFLKNAEKKGCKILNGLGMSSSRGLLRSNYGPDRRLHWM